MQKVYPDLKSEANKDVNPSVQRVASASNGSRQQAQGKRTGIKISSDHLSVKNNIKPRGMSQSDWLKRIGKEIVKIEFKEETWGSVLFLEYEKNGKKENFQYSVAQDWVKYPLKEPTKFLKVDWEPFVQYVKERQ